MKIDAGAASRLRTLLKRRKAHLLKLNIPQLARLGLFSRSTQGHGLASLFQLSTPGSFSVRDATVPAMSGTIHNSMRWWIQLVLLSPATSLRRLPSESFPLPHFS
jgi:hypothetical protein